MTRQQINATDTLMDIILKMSEGNPGALSILTAIATYVPPGSDEDFEAIMNFHFFLHLDDMNLWGAQIWVAYKNWAGGDMAKFLKGILDRDQEMIDAVNEKGMQGNHTERAVKSGASFERPQELVLSTRKEC